jgi:Tfp pilus assembly protein PilE
VFGRARARAATTGFTTVELMVVLGVIALILGIGLPAFKSMTDQAYRTQARQMINSALMQAHVLSLSDRAMAAVRFSPDWERANASGKLTTDAQVVTIYQYKFTSLNADPSAWSTQGEIAGGEFVQFNERFERVDEIAPQTLPNGLWVAPSEALLHDPTDNSGFYGLDVLEGNPGDFEIDADASNDKLLDADDFLIVFDPQAGVLPSRWPQPNPPPGVRKSPWQLLGYDPRPGRGFHTAWDTNARGVPLKPLEAYRRFNFTGVVLYDRELFLAGDRDDQERQEFLARQGETYYVDRIGGGLSARRGQVQ